MSRTKRRARSPRRPAPNTTGTEYDRQAQNWLEKTDSRLEIAFDHTGRYFDDDEETRDIYRVTLTRGRASYTFTFGQSVAYSAPFVGAWPINRGRYFYDNHCTIGDTGYKCNPDRAQPSAYSILACLESHNPGTFEEFCAECGYDTDSRKAEKTWRACVEQYLRLDSMYSREELDAIGEIR